MGSVAEGRQARVSRAWGLVHHFTIKKKKKRSPCPYNQVKTQKFALFCLRVRARQLTLLATWTVQCGPWMPLPVISSLAVTDNLTLPVAVACRLRG